MKIFFLLVIAVSLVSGDRMVTTNSGPIRGSSVPGKKVEAFLGVPFAEPPVGELRFAKPVPKSPWKATYDANKLPPACVQCLSIASIPLDNMDEDCLYLNLWVPEGGSDLKPILVFIHGGAFMIGSSIMPDYNGVELAKHGDIIVMTFNYRVGTLGFFSAFIEEAKGSMGMYDQVTAIQWIKDNAKHFGGDPDNIVLFGESAGSISVSLHMISPLSKNLFKRAIMQSGTAFQPKFNSEESLLIRCQKIAALLGCANNTYTLKEHGKEVLNCMEDIPYPNFSVVDADLMSNLECFNPVAGNDFLPNDSIVSFQNSDWKGKVLYGKMGNEGSLFLRWSCPEMFAKEAKDISFEGVSLEELMGNMTAIGGEHSDIFKMFYSNRVENETECTNLVDLCHFVGDFIITCSTVFLADCQSNKNIPVYIYTFDYQQITTMIHRWMGAYHSSGLPFLFGNCGNGKMTSYEEKTRKFMMTMVVNFARNGNPNSPGETNWHPYTSEHPEYLLIGNNGSNVVQGRPDNFRCEAWKEEFRYQH